MKDRASILLTVPINPSGITVREFLGLFENEKNDKVFDELYSGFNISKIANSFLDSISDGERQKVLLLKVLSKDVDLFILDEPGTFLDYSTKKYLYDFIRRMVKEQKRGVLISSHDLDHLRETIDGSYRLHDGTGELTVELKS